MGFSDEWKNVTTKVPQGGEADINYVNGDLVFEFNLSAEQWQELLYNSVDSQYLHWPFEIILKDATELSNVGTYYKNEEGIDFIFVANYFKSYGGIGWPIEIANISTDGSKAIVTPKNLDGTYLFKWKDESGVEHFHQINFQIKHASEDAVVVDSVEPGKSRIKLNVNELENVDGEYQDGVVTYSINEEPGWDAEIITTVERPNSSVAKVNVINTMNDQNWVQELGEGNIAAILGIPADEGKEGMITYKLEWLNSNDKLDSSDLITVKVLPIYAGAWMEKYWAPVENTGLVEDNGLSEHLTYKNGGWTFEVDPASKNTLDVERLSTNERLIYILVPEGAKYFRMTSGESSLYWYDGADGDKAFLEGGKLIPIEDAENETSMKLVTIDGKKALAAHFGSIFTKSSFKNDNLDVYVVNEDVTGHGTYRIIEWFDESEKQIYFGEKRGQYIYMEKKPYMQTAETELGFDIYDSITPNPGEAYAIVWDYEPDKIEELKGLMFRCEVPLQKETHGNHRYVYQKLDLIDADGNVVELPKGTTIKVVLPYPEGLNKNNTQLEFFDVWHYEDETHDKYESMRQKGVLALENIGVTFITDSFSPFLLSYEPDEESKIIESLVPGRTDLKITQREEVPKDAGFYGEDAKVALEALYGTEDTMAAVKVKLEKDADEDISSIPGVKSDTFESVVLEISLQYWDDSSKEWKKITKDNLSLLPKDGVDVIIPFELFDFTDVNHLGNYEFLVKHLITLPASDLHYVGEIEDMKVTVTGEGLKIKVKNGFSPFVVAYAEKYVTSGTGSSSGKSSISVTYNGGSSFSTSKSAVPTSVEIDGVPVSFTGDGNSFTVSEIPAGAKWITVRWNSTSITVNFTPNGNVVSAGIEIPKTGDISLIAFALMAVAAAAGAMGKK